jgi:hypothetical protein
MPETKKEWLQSLKVGDTVTRWLAGDIPMNLIVAALTDDIVDCGWTFCRQTGCEIDDDLGWGPPPKMTGSFIAAPKR